MPLIRSISGLRATLEDCLTPEVIVNYTNAFAMFLPPGPVVLGADGRESWEWISKVVSESLLSLGRDVIYLGIAPTPTVQLITEHTDAAGGICITASHNPQEWNGLKFLNSSGVFLDSEENTEFWNILDKTSMHNHPESVNANLVHFDEPIKFHIDKITSSGSFNPELIKRIRGRQFKVVVDAVNASGSDYVPALLKELGCEVIELFCDKSGIFPHAPEPLPVNLTSLSAAVKEYRADVGIAVDPDADRLVLVDENGNNISEELTISLAINSYFILNPGIPGRKVVVNLSTTKLAEDIAMIYHGILLRSPVGEINVVKKMKEIAAVIGGEGSGGVILPECHYGRDSLVGASLILALLAVENKSLSRIIEKYPKYYISKSKIEFQGNIKDIFKKLIDTSPGGKVDLQDGMRIDFDDSWLQVRASNTEPIIRVLTEANSQSKAEQLSNRALEVIGRI